MLNAPNNTSNMSKVVTNKQNTSLQRLKRSKLFTYNWFWYITCHTDSLISNLKVAQLGYSIEATAFKIVVKKVIIPE